MEIIEGPSGPIRILTQTELDHLPKSGEHRSIGRTVLVAAGAVALAASSYALGAHRGVDSTESVHSVEYEDAVGTALHGSALAPTTTIDVETFTSQLADASVEQEGEYRYVDPGLAAASTVRIETVCTFGDTLRPVSHGTGGIYQRDNSLEIGTVAHIGDTDYGLPNEHDTCHFSVSITTQNEDINMTLPSGSFRASYTHDAPLDAVVDQPVFAAIPPHYADRIIRSMSQGNITPLQPDMPTIRDAQVMVIYRNHFASGPVQSTLDTEDSLIGTFVTDIDEELITYYGLSGNICSGNSGAPVLRMDKNGHPTRQAMAVVSNALGGERCGDEGMFVGFQSP